MQSTDVLSAIDQLADKWVTEREDRFQRRHLDPADFEALADTGYLRLIVPEAHGGLWTSLAETGPVLLDAVGRLARGDQSVALVASMSPAVLAIWAAAAAEAPEPYKDAWSAQRAQVFQTAMAGHFWGTLTSEPGSGGDVMRTRATATPVDGISERCRLYGAKHFGSGSGLVSYMITTAKPDGLDLPQVYYVDLRDQPWDGTAGLSITRPWDGVGMKATQSHAVMFDGVEGTAFAWPSELLQIGKGMGALGRSMFASVTAAIVDSAMAEAEIRLSGRSLRPYEDVEWSNAPREHWLLTQARSGLATTLSLDDPGAVALATVKAKMGMATLAESILSRLSRAVGGGAFSANSPFACWNEDVRALGYLRPPWALAFDQLSAARRPDEEPPAEI